MGSHNILSPNSKIKVVWADRPENYSKEAKNKIKNYFTSKYGVLKNNISVTYQPVKKNDKGEIIELQGAKIENIMDLNYQRILMKELITRDNIVIDFDRIIALDNKVNGEINIDQSAKPLSTWTLKWLMIDNFLSYGEKNYLSMSKLKGLTVVNSIPVNQGGKTTLTIDAVKFLLHGVTTKTDKNEDVFNAYSGKNELVVRGMIEIETNEFIIERKMRRSAKKTGGWTVVNKVNFYELLPDGTEKLQNEEDAKKTTKLLKESVGSDKDFEMLVLATEHNLDDLIGLTTTESGKLLSRLIGLEITEIKEAAVRTMYNDFNKKKKGNEFNSITLNEEIIEHESKIVSFTELNTLLDERLKTTKEEIIKLNAENDRLILSKEKIDVTITALNPSKLQDDVNSITLAGKGLKERSTQIIEQIKTLNSDKYNETKHYQINKRLMEISNFKAVTNAEISRLEKVVKDLIAGGICQACNRKLDNVDNTEHIATHNKKIEELKLELTKIKTEEDGLNLEVTGLLKFKEEFDLKNKLELDKDRLEVEMGSLRNQLTAKMNDLKKYNLNLSAIDFNKNVDGLISKIKTDISVAEFKKEETIGKLAKITSDLTFNRESVINKTKLIETLKKEEEIDKIFKVYIDLVGKKGISKLVLRSVLPIINSELQRLLEDTCDFEIEIFIDDKNDVQFLILKDEVYKPLKSASGFEKTAASVALRSVLGKVSTLPMPNFITFDEVLGRVGAENFDNMKMLFDKIKDMYDIVFLITHNNLVKDWSNNIITVFKPQNTSTLYLD